jgi:hypothetical protein
MSANLAITSELEAPTANVTEKVVATSGIGPGVTRWCLVGAQVLVLVAYAMGLGFLIKTTAGTLVLFSLVAPVLVAVAMLTLIGVAIYEFRRRHGITAFEVYDSGQIIFRQGEVGDCAYFIQSGEVEMVRNENGSDNVIARLSEGDYFGEKSLIIPSPRTVTTRALTQTRVGIIRKRSFFAMVVVLPAGVDAALRNSRFTKRRRKIAG